jgi:integrase
MGHHPSQPRRRSVAARVLKPDVHPPSVKQIAEMLAIAVTEQPELATYILVAASSGARRREVLALRWKDVDLETGTLVIGRGIVIGESGVVEKDTKTHQVRRLSLDPSTLANLRAHRERRTDICATLSVPLSAENYIFAGTADGKVPWHPNSISRAFRELADATDATDIRLHDLRHYVASQLLSNGIDVRTVAGRLGHRNASTTLNVYGHFLPEADQKAATVLGGLLDAAVSERETEAAADESSDADVPPESETGDQTAPALRRRKRRNGNTARGTADHTAEPPQLSGEASGDIP